MTDTFLAAYLEKHDNHESGHVNYFSLTVCNGLIEVLGKKVMCAIVIEVQAKYYSISFDLILTCHVHQLCIIIRYVLTERPVELFLTFGHLLNHAGKEADVVLDLCKIRDFRFLIIVVNPMLKPVTSMENVAALRYS